MNKGGNEPLPQHIRDLPIQVQVAVLYERVKNLDDEVAGLRRALWSFVFSLLGGALLFLLSIAAGWIGPRAHSALEVARWLGVG